MYNAQIKTIMHDQQRYETLGDYYTEGGVTQFRVSSMGNRKYEFLISQHELIEKELALTMGITEQQIDAWDLAHEDAEEPGELEGCPYREAHLIAEGFERALAVKLGVDWDHYAETCRAVIAKHLPPKDPTVRDVDGFVLRKDGRQPNSGRRNIPKGKVRERSVLRDK